MPHTNRTTRVKRKKTPEVALNITSARYGVICTTFIGVAVAAMVAAKCWVCIWKKGVSPASVHTQVCLKERNHQFKSTFEYNQRTNQTKPNFGSNSFCNTIQFRMEKPKNKRQEQEFLFAVRHIGLKFPFELHYLPPKETTLVWSDQGVRLSHV